MMDSDARVSTMDEEPGQLRIGKPADDGDATADDYRLVRLIIATFFHDIITCVVRRRDYDHYP